jgi:deoxyribonuclease-4
MKKLLFGTAGIPISSKGSTTAEGINGVRELDLDAMELEFVRSVNISKEKAPEVRKSAEQIMLFDMPCPLLHKPEFT